MSIFDAALRMPVVIAGRSFVNVPPTLVKDFTACLHGLTPAFFGSFFSVSGVGTDFRPEEVSTSKPSKSAGLVCAIAAYSSRHAKPCDCYDLSHT
jgi:hypothetical protein